MSQPVPPPPPPEVVGPSRAAPHVLRPHHVALAALTVILFRIPPGSPSPWPPRVFVNVLQILLDEVAELCQPRSFKQLIHGISSPTDSSPLPEHHDVAFRLQQYPKILQESGAIATLFEQLYGLVYENDELTSAPIDRRSILGAFCRRCRLSFTKLSFPSIIQLQKQFLIWTKEGNPSDVNRDVHSLNALVFPTSADENEAIRQNPYLTAEVASGISDPSLAGDSLHRFFDQHFRLTEGGIHQHALLSLARYHLQAGHTTAAQKTLNEAITISRTNGDKVTLEHCLSVGRRLRKLTSGPEDGLRPRPKTFHEDVLWDINSMIATDRTMSQCFDKIYESIGALNTPSPHAAVQNQDHLYQHSAQSVLWTRAGCEKLAEIEENIVLAYSESGSEDDQHLKMKCSKARRACRQGDVEHALSILLSPSTWSDLTMGQYVLWSHEVWGILVQHLTRRGQQQHATSFLRAMQPPITAQGAQKDHTKPNANDLLRETLQYHEAGETAQALQALLGLLWKFELTGNYRLYRAASILMADLSLEMSLECKSLTILRDLMPQVMNGDDLEQRAYACYTMGRTVIAVGKGDEKSLRESLPYLLLAEKDYSALAIPSCKLNVLGFLTMVHHRLGMEEELEGAAARHGETQEELNEMRREEVSQEVKKVWALVGRIGQRIANKYMAN